jgi:6-phosphogluconolactonase
LAAEPRRSQIDWSKVVVFWGDERCVPPDDPQSNYRMAYEALLKHVPIPEAQIYRIHGEDDPLHAASDYAATIRTVLNAPDAMPAFDTIILGIGTDGHIASLFPGTLLLAEREALVAAGWVAQQDQHRVSLTLPLINAAQSAIFIVAGASKAAALRQIAQGDPHLPATLVKPAAPPLWMLDAAAAAEL